MKRKNANKECMKSNADRAKLMYHKGLSITEIGLRLNLTEATVRNYIRM